MLPNYALQEMLRRLPPERARVMMRSVGIDPDMTLPPVEPGFFQRREFNGDLNFDLTIGALGHCVSIPCRLSFTADLADDVDAETAGPIRVLGHAQQVCHAFVPTRDDDPVFEWVQIDERMLPAAAVAKLDDQVEELALMMEGTQR